MRKPVVLPARAVTASELATLASVPLGDVVGALLAVRAEGHDSVPDRVAEQLAGGRKAAPQALGEVGETLRLSVDASELVLLQLGLDVERAIEDDRMRSTAVNESTPRRAPIVVTMGHVDHGKTTLLDALRKTAVAQAEKGGITQAVNAFSVALSGGAEQQRMVFLDTPGHEAFAAMRQNGTAVTDLAIVCVAATDGVMPQTVEAVELARKAGLPVVFALTKTDLAKAAATDVASRKLTDYLQLHGLARDSDLVVPVVAPKGQGLPELVEALLMQAEAQGFPRADPAAPGEGVVLESRLDKALGAVADAVVRWGTLHVGDVVLCGTQVAKVRTLRDETGRPIKEAGPSTPVSLSGFSSLPQAGSDLFVMRDEAEAKRVAAARAQREQRANALAPVVKGPSRGPKPKQNRAQRSLAYAEKQKETAMAIAKEEAARAKQVPLILKADSDGALAALKFAVQRMRDEMAAAGDDRQVVVVKASVGHVTESDVDLAEEFDARVLGFNVRASGALMKAAKSKRVVVESHPVIYNLLDDVKSELKKAGRTVLGKANVQAVFSMKPKKRTDPPWIVAGCRVAEGAVGKNDRIAVRRGGVIVCESTGVGSLRILKKDVDKVDSGHECGLAVTSFEDFKVGDVIEAFRME